MSIGFSFHSLLKSLQLSHAPFLTKKMSLNANQRTKSCNLHDLARTPLTTTPRRMNEVNACGAPLVPGYVTVFGRVYHLGM